MMKILGMLMVISFSASSAIYADTDIAFLPDYQWSGFIQTDIYAGENDTSDSAENSFHIRRARLAINGKVLPALSYQVMTAYDGGNDTSAELKALNVFAQYQLNSSWALTIGQFKYSFDREGRPAAHQSPFIYFSKPTNQFVTKLGREGSALRDMGIEARWAHQLSNQKQFQLYMGIINGNGINGSEYQENTQNDHKDMYVRATWDVVDSLNVGLAAYHGTIVDSSETLDEEIWTLDAAYNIGKWTFIGAVIQGEYEELVGADARPFGYYLASVYQWQPKIDFVFRRQLYDADQEADLMEQNSWDIGMNYFIQRKGRWSGTKFSINYLFRDAEQNAKTRIWEDRGDIVVGSAVHDVLAARFQITF